MCIFNINKYNNIIFLLVIEFFLYYNNIVFENIYYFIFKRIIFNLIIIIQFNLIKFWEKFSFIFFLIKNG